MHTPQQIPLIFLQKMDLLLKKTPQDEVKRQILPMILASLETEHRQVQVRSATSLVLCDHVYTTVLFLQNPCLSDK